MKKLLLNIHTLAALLMVGAAFTACSSEEDVLAEQPVSKTEKQVYTITVNASKGDDATTRGLSHNASSTEPYIKVTWNGDEKVIVCKSSGTTGWESIGELTPAKSDNGSTTLTGTVTEAPTSGLRFFLNSVTTDYSNQNNSLYGANGIEYLESAYGDLLFSDYTVDETTKTITPSKAVEFTSRQAIVRFELEDMEGKSFKATKLLIHDAHGVMRSVNGAADGIDAHTFGDVTVNAEDGLNGDDEFWVALCHVLSTSILQITATTPDGDTYMYNAAGTKEVGKIEPEGTISDGGFVHGKYYEITVKMEKVLDLSTVKTETTVPDGTIMTGKLAAGGSIILGTGTYTLAGVDINSDKAITDGKSGISCTGNTNIVLEGANKVHALSDNYPGIWIKNGFTLTIEGEGSLEATGNYGAGIGCASYLKEADEKDCGNITISGGTITATSEIAPGIGSGRVVADTGYPSSKCDDITIESGATVTASSGSSEAASIGTAAGDSSGQSYCESITIKSGATVTVTKNTNAEAIGKGNGGTMGKDPVIETGANVTIN